MGIQVPVVSGRIKMLFEARKRPAGMFGRATTAHKFRIYFRHSVVSITKFSIAIGSGRAYFLRYWSAIMLGVRITAVQFQLFFIACIEGARVI